MKKWLNARVALVLILWAVAFSACLGQGKLESADILKYVTDRQVPPMKYTVRVVQVVICPPSSSPAQSTLSTQSALPADTGTAIFEPSAGLKRTTARRTDEDPDLRVPRLIVDLSAILKEFSSLDNVIVDTVSLNNRPHYLLSGEDSQKTKGAKIWIDEEERRVTQIKISLMGREFADIGFEYTNQLGDCWLPSTIMFNSLADNSRIRLEYSGYTFSN